MDCLDVAVTCCSEKPDQDWSISTLALVTCVYKETGEMACGRRHYSKGFKKESPGEFGRLWPKKFVGEHEGFVELGREFLVNVEFEITSAHGAPGDFKIPEYLIK
eukprot:TRINITY_DN71649_c0_g1_i1.p1 TRINITY_DN71649_c0_g1~~TRINITY_DN71649_c0_g1_i1.p1  ORF type:complete len:105 (-),score=14.73 TRINITY_DN71649_c0_g1_i1:6-320(-)